MRFPSGEIAVGRDLVGRLRDVYEFEDVLPPLLDGLDVLDVLTSLGSGQSAQIITGMAGRYCIPDR